MLTLPFLPKTSKEHGASIVTVCWMDEGLSMLRWYVPEDGVPSCLGSKELASVDCDAAGYLKALGNITPPVRTTATSVRWILMHDQVIPAGDGEDGYARIPGWIEACWADLPAPVIPDSVYPGFICLERALCDWPLFHQPGVGACFPVHGRWLFFGFGENGCFRRISKGIADQPGNCPVVDREWLQQTRMLYQGRTGLELRKVLLPGSSVVSPGQISGVDLEHGTGSGAWPQGRPADVPPPLQFLHASALKHGDEGLLQSISLLGRRKAAHRLVSVFRLATFMLFGGWIFLMLGACRGDHSAVADGSELGRQWRREVGLWNDSNRKWGRQSKLRRERAVPYHLVGSVVSTTPEGVGLRRLSLVNEEPQESGFSLVLEGSFKGEDASAVFGSWMQQLRQQSSLAHVENLQFEKAGEDIHFHLKGKTFAQGGSE